MSYLFNDDKSKRDIVIIERTVLNVGSNKTKTDVLSAEYLSAYGIDAAWKYTVIGALTYAVPNFANWMHNSSYITVKTITFPQDIEVEVGNNYSESQTIGYRLVLMRTA